MAHVLSADDVERARIPTPQSFECVFIEIRQKLKDVSGIQSVVRIGSTERGDTNCLSDADVVVAYDRASRTEIFVALAFLCKRAADMFVELEIIPLDIEFAFHGIHNWTLSFTSHVRWAEKNGGVLLGNPIAAQVVPRDKRYNEGLDYALENLHKILKRRTRYAVVGSEKQNDLLTAVVQVPIYLARKVVWDRGVKLPLDSKKDVILAYENIASEEEKEYFQHLLSIAARYRRLVESKPRAAEYETRKRVLLEEHGLEILTLYLEATIKHIIAVK